MHKLKTEKELDIAQLRVLLPDLRSLRDYVESEELNDWELLSLLETLEEEYILSEASGTKC